jgi:uncharacterized membrane protein/thiol-disulfide isomerase/thioredoxin
MKRHYAIVVLFLLVLIMPLTAVAQQADRLPIVQVVLFYSPTCPHCHEVMTTVLPPLAEQYGDQLQILGVDTTKEVGSALYQAAIEHFAVAAGRRGVPTLIAGTTVLVGGGEIPAQLPGLIEAGLAAGGLGWPEIPGLMEAMPDLPPSADPNLAVEIAPETAVAPTTPPEPASADQTGALNLAEINADNETEAAAAPPPADPVGFAIGWMIFLGMLAALLYGLWRSIQARSTIPERLADPEARLVHSTAVPVLLLIGLGVALYLAYVEVNQVTAVCGPIGECNQVQSSDYAKIMGIPVAVLGIFNYLALGVIWVFQRPLNEKFNNLGVYGLLALTSIGTLFSLYLTLLELLVIDAVCAWCLSSAVITTLLFIIVVNGLTKRPSPGQPGLSAGD